MNQLDFTPYVAELCAGRTPTDARHSAIRQTLERGIRRELMQRSLWSVPPSYLGFYGDRDWFRKPRGPLEDLTTECYSAIFLERLQRLCAHLKLKPNIDGLVYRNIRNYIHDLQQRHDPLGTRIYQLVHGAVRDLLETGDLWVADGPEGVTNATLLAFSDSDAEVVGPMVEATLREQVGVWCEALMPTLVTTRGRGLTQLRDDIRARILTLPDAAIEAFHFRHLVQPFKQIARGRWGTALDTEQGEKGFAEDPEEGAQAREPLTLPHNTFEDRQSFRHLLECVERELETLARSGDEARLAELRAVWDLLVAWAADHPEATEAAKPPLDPERLPSRRQVSRVLDLPRDRLPPLYDKLGALIQGCHAPGVAARKGATMALDRPASPQHASARVAPGAVYLLRAAAAWDLEWVVLEPGETGSWWIAPTDDHPLAGPEDLRLTHRTVRCGLALPIPAALLEDDLFVETLEDAATDRLLAHHRALQEGTLRPTLRQEEAALAPEYDDWMAEGPRPAHAAVREAARFLAPPRREPRPSPLAPRRRWSLAAAALFALLTVGLSFLLWQTQQELVRANGPRLVSQAARIQIDETTRAAQRWVLEPDEQALAVEIAVFKDFHCRNYTLELARTDGRPLWTSDTVDPAETIRLVIPRTFLKQKPTQLNLYGVCQGKRELLEKVEVTVVLRE